MKVQGPFSEESDKLCWDTLDDPSQPIRRWQSSRALKVGGLTQGGDEALGLWPQETHLPRQWLWLSLSGQT